MNEAWYISRAAGFVAYGLLFLVVAMGLAIHTRVMDRLCARWRVTDLHMFGSILAIVFVAVHAGVLLLDTYIGYSPIQVLVPFTAATRTAWTAVGIVSAYLMAAIVASFYVRRWIGYRAWRFIHYSTFLLYVTATLHGIFTGTDTVTGWAQLIYIVTGGCVLALFVARLMGVGQRPRDRSQPPQRQPQSRARADTWRSPSQS